MAMDQLVATDQNLHNTTNEIRVPVTNMQTNSSGGGIHLPILVHVEGKTNEGRNPSLHLYIRVAPSLVLI